MPQRTSKMGSRPASRIGSGNDEGRLDISMLVFDLDFAERVTPAAVLVLGVGLLFACVITLGLVLLQSWAPEWFLRSSSWLSSSSGLFFD